MKNITKHFGLAAVAFSITLLMSSFTPEVHAPIDGAQTDNCKINSRYGGVQIGAITYSFRSIREIDAVIQACVDAGLSSVELMETGIEAYLHYIEIFLKILSCFFRSIFYFLYF